MTRREKLAVGFEGHTNAIRMMASGDSEASCWKKDFGVRNERRFGLVGGSSSTVAGQTVLRRNRTVVQKTSVVASATFATASACRRTFLSGGSRSWPGDAGMCYSSSTRRRSWTYNTIGALESSELLLSRYEDTALL